MRKADFGPVDCAITSCFNESEQFGVFRVDYKCIDRSLLFVREFSAVMEYSLLVRRPCLNK